MVGALILRTRVPEPDSARDRFLARFSERLAHRGRGRDAGGLVARVCSSPGRSPDRCKELTVATEAMSRGELRMISRCARTMRSAT